MTPRPFKTLDGNEAVASVAHRTNEVIAIYPITPSSTMGELADEWSSKGKMNIWGRVPDVVEMQSEAGAAGAVHGSLQAGALTTTFTASQGLLLMIPNMYKIAGELTPFCMHVAARTIATHALSIFGDHSDVMACRQIGFAILGSGSVQEAHDFAAIAQAATLRTRIPFLHFFDGFRTSHEITGIEMLSDDDLRALLPDTLVSVQRDRAMTPDHPVLRGTAQNPDTFFQAREAANGFHDACAEMVAAEMRLFEKLTGRSYGLFDYVGHPDAERVVVVMGSGAEVAHETVEWMVERGEKVGVLKVRLYRPFAADAFLRALPKSVRSIAVLDRTKEPGAVGEPLFVDVMTVLAEAEDTGRLPFAKRPRVIGGRYGLSSKEFDPAMVRAVFAELAKPEPKRRFTIGIVDDVTGLSLEWDRDFAIEFPDRVEAIFYGLGADGTVGANKNSIKIIGEETDHEAQGYFVYDSKKSGAVTISHLRFGSGHIRSSYLVKHAGFVACHQFNFLERYDVLENARDGATFLLNAPYPPEELWDRLPFETQEAIVRKKLHVYAIDAYRVARENGMGGRTNSVMQTAFFAISGVLPKDEAIGRIKAAIEKTYGKKGAEIVRKNFAAVDATIANLAEMKVPAAVSLGATRRPPMVSAAAPDFVKKVEAVMLAGHGDLLPVSAFPIDGTWPVGTSRWEKRNIAQEIPVWDTDLCIQCNKCAFVCPHAAIRPKHFEAPALLGAPATFKSTEFRSLEYKDHRYALQVAPEDCTGCTLCVVICPAKDKADPTRKALAMRPQAPLREAERENYDFFLKIPNPDRSAIKGDVKSVQFLEPLFEYSGACAGCGETPYIKLLTQLFGDRALVANATGCSSIFGGNLPTTPYTTNAEGRGPAWANSLFEDNAEFGLGMRLAVDHHQAGARALVGALRTEIGPDFATALLDADQKDEAGIALQRGRVLELKHRLTQIDSPSARRLHELADYLVKKSVWIVGGDGWAYDIGFGGLDHVLSTNAKVNILVLDTEVYSNTGGQQSKATPLAAAAKFATAGKPAAKKDLGMMAMSYGHVYVARIAFGAKDTQTVRTLLEAEAYPGPSLIIAYSHCIAHGYDMAHGCDQQKLAVDAGLWPLYRFDPRRVKEGLPPLLLESSRPKIPVMDFMKNEARFMMTDQSDHARFEELARRAQKASDRRWAVYEQLAAIKVPNGAPASKPTS